MLRETIEMVHIGDISRQHENENDKTQSKYKSEKRKKNIYWTKLNNEQLH